MQHNNATRKARIATAIVLAALAIVVTTPTVVADEEPTLNDDGSATYGPCAGIDAGQTPPSYYVDVWSCFPA